MKLIKKLLFAVVMMVGLSVAAMAQKDDQKKLPPKNPPVINPGQDKKPPKENPPKGNGPKKPGNAFATWVKENEADLT